MACLWLRGCAQPLPPKVFRASVRPHVCGGERAGAGGSVPRNDCPPAGGKPHLEASQLPPPFRLGSTGISKGSRIHAAPSAWLTPHPGPLSGSNCSDPVLSASQALPSPSSRGVMSVCAVFQCPAPLSERPLPHPQMLLLSCSEYPCPNHLFHTPHPFPVGNSA